MINLSPNHGVFFPENQSVNSPNIPNMMTSVLGDVIKLGQHFCFYQKLHKDGCWQIRQEPSKKRRSSAPIWGLAIPVMFTFFFLLHVTNLCLHHKKNVSIWLHHCSALCFSNAHVHNYIYPLFVQTAASPQILFLVLGNTPDCICMNCLTMLCCSLCPLISKNISHSYCKKINTLKCHNLSRKWPITWKMLMLMGVSSKCCY